jgi:flavorubredoxin
MKSVVVYESHWGNTAAVARAIAEEIGPEARALTTDEAVGTAIQGVDLLVAGAPVIAFSLPREIMTKQIATDDGGPAPGDLSHPLLRTWLEALPHGTGMAAAFETRVSGSPGGSTGAIESRLKSAGYRRAVKGERFKVQGKYGPLKEGELDRARTWGRTLGLLARA